ncbi:hypothetical protein K432DRAFT_385476 [Lepidopterella palustris CBS 459.81]|uniref:Uncharacterized protein n=1 Tax=Lepidopterella palustris CBS 459.81 TaxID=1314670 RepID=A0A8E2JBI7_9PEZI|nr:hypothetical protein K432DRAFT_385476 [Lepidopterella palustris CBS 459.81]
MEEPSLPRLQKPQTSPSSTAEVIAVAGTPHHHHFSHHGHGIAESTTSTILPPTLTPETTQRQSVALGILSDFWSSSSNPNSLSANHNLPSNSNNPTSADPDADADITLNHHSAALRALNTTTFPPRARRHHQPTKSASIHTTLSSQPVVVRTYSGSRSRPTSTLASPHLLPTPPGMARRTKTSRVDSPALPAVSDFTFAGILRAVDPEIRDAIDAIAEICARSRLSLADEYDAHLPPQGEFVNTGSAAAAVGLLGGRRRDGFVGNSGGARFGGWGNGNSEGRHALQAVPEASSSSERLAGESRGSTRAGSVGMGVGVGVGVGSGKSKGNETKSAYGSLKSVMSGSKRITPSLKPEASTAQDSEATSLTTHDSEETQHKISSQTPSHANPKPTPPAPASHWVVTTNEATHHPSITLVTTPTASNHVSLDFPTPSTSTVSHSTPSPSTISSTLLTGSSLPTNPSHRSQQPLHRRHTSLASAPLSNAQSNVHFSPPSRSHTSDASAPLSLPRSRARSTTLSTLTSWIPSPWSRAPTAQPSTGANESAVGLDATRAEARLRVLLRASSSAVAEEGVKGEGQGHGKQVGNGEGNGKGNGKAKAVLG